MKIVMNKIKRFLKIVAVMLFASTFILSNGNENKYELGTAMYRELGTSPVNHWHTGIYQYFEYLPKGKGRK